jgi:hypothetical protein
LDSMVAWAAALLVRAEKLSVSAVAPPLAAS